MLGDLGQAPHCLEEEIKTKKGQIRSKLKCLLPTSPTFFLSFCLCDSFIGEKVCAEELEEKKQYPTTVQLIC